MSVAEAHPERLVLDLGRLVFVDVAGVRALDDTTRHWKPSARSFSAGPGPRLASPSRSPATGRI